MATLVPRAPYTEDELKKLYPPGLELQLVQVILRHGERSPVSTRFRNAGLPAYWPYCNAARKLRSAIMEDRDGKQWSSLEWRRRLETFGPDDGPALAAGSDGETDGICNLGELTDQGRGTTLALGQRLRHLYVDQLKFMPQLLADADMMYLRATPIPRALESVQQAFTGMYPKTARTAAFPSPTIISRTPADETLFPNDGMCRRFNQLSRAVAQRTADRWNETPEMDYVNKLISKWMPEDSKRVAVDGHPRFSGIMDTVNSTLAHPAPTRLPSEFYDTKLRAILDKVGVEEWFSGYKESQEYRAVGIGGLVGDIVERMVGSAERNSNDGLVEIGEMGRGRGGESRIQFGMSGAHDTTLAAVLTSLGAFDGEPWPPYTSHVAFELLKRSNVKAGGTTQIGLGVPTLDKQEAGGKGFWTRFVNFGPARAGAEIPITRRKVDTLNEKERQRMDGYYVRIRYNDKVMKVPGCAPEGNHLDGDDSFCTLEAFKRIVDKFTPENWRESCVSNLDKPAFPEKPQPAGW